MTTAIGFEGVTVRYGKVSALNTVSLDVAEGQMFGLIGPDGAGKTSAIRLACGLVHADEGRARVFGRDPAREHSHITADVGYLSQRFSLYGDLTVDENIAFFAEVHSVGHYAERRNQLLDMMQLAPFRGRLASKLSGGMKQKLALACTLVHQPRLLLLDEPTTGVDPVSRREFWKLLSEFLSQGITILLSTPYLDEAERCAQVALLHEGRVLTVDTPSAIRARVPGRIVEVTAVAPSRELEVDTISALPDVLDAQVFGDRLHVTLTADDDDTLTRFSGHLNRLPHVHAAVRPVPPSLEDAFISILSQQEVTA